MTLDAPPVPAQRAPLSPDERAAARRGGLALLALTVLAIPGNLLIHGDWGRWVVMAGALAFVAVSLLDVFVGVDLWRITRSAAPGAGLLALVSRVMTGVVQGYAAAALVIAGGHGVDRFDILWDVSMLVFGVHLVLLTVALIARRVPRVVPLATALAGTAYLLDALPDGWRVSSTDALLPFMFGELVLLGWLLLAGLRDRGRPHC